MAAQRAKRRRAGRRRCAARLVERRRAEAARGRGAGGDLRGRGARRWSTRRRRSCSAADREEVATRIVRDSVGLGPLEVLLADPAVEEVMVNGPDRVYRRARRPDRADRRRLRRRGGAAQRDRADPGAARPPGRRAQPDGRRPARRRLAGQRRDPAAGDRRAARSRSAASARAGPGPTELVALGTLTAAQRAAAGGGGRRRAAASSSAAAPAPARRRCSTRSPASSTPGERVVTIEDAAELRLQQPHVVRLESRPAGVEGRGEVTIRDLLRNALRMRPGPDRDRRGARRRRRSTC